MDLSDKKYSSTWTIIACALVVFCIFFYKQYYWDNSEIKYAIGKVKGFSPGGAGPSIPKYTYKINNKEYIGKKYNIIQDKYYIIAIPTKRFDFNVIEIEIPINPNDLVRQPPEGWNECPINKDGTIKAKYRRRDKNGNIIKSKPTDKSSIKKKKNKNEEKIDEQALDLIFENRK